MNLIQKLFPGPQEMLPLNGLYLSHDIRARGAGQPYVYTNYIVSLDGRIAVPHPDQPGLSVPQAIANERDWRLFQELAVQADVILTSGRYLREYAKGRVQEILRIYDDPRFADLKEWRIARNLPLQPALAVISASLDFPIPDGLLEGGRKVLVFTAEAADPQRLAALRARTDVFLTGKISVDGKLLVEQLSQRGLSFIYNATGPKVNHLLLQAGVLNRLYLTHANRLLGGEPFSTIVQGDLLNPPVGMKMDSLYFDSAALQGDGQLLVVYDQTG
jgi:riboflavin biosynthesis pyrimidine reductase